MIVTLVVVAYFVTALLKETKSGWQGDAHDHHQTSSQRPASEPTV